MRLIFVSFVALSFIAPTLFGYTITTFNPTSFISTGSSPTSTTVSNLNNVVGLNGAIIEDFEDDTMIAGLTLNMQGINNASPSSVSPQNRAVAAWNGNRSIVPSIQTHEAIFNYAPGASFFAMGVGDVESDVRLIVNGQDMGLIRSMPNYNRQIDNAREIYIRIDQQSGDTAITEVKFTTTGIADGLFLDHVAVSSAVPEPGTFVSLLFALLSVCFLRLRRG